MGVRDYADDLTLLDEGKALRFFDLNLCRCQRGWSSIGTPVCVCGVATRAAFGSSTGASGGKRYSYLGV